MKPRTLLIIAAVFAVVVSFYVVFENIYLPKKEKGKERENKVFTLTREDLDLIKIQTEHSVIILVREKDKDRWVMTAPIKSDVDAGEVESFIASALDTEVTRKLGTKEQLKDSMGDFGLDEPKLSVVLGSGDNSEVLSLGNVVASGGEVYATRKGDDQVFLVDEFVTEDLNRDTTTLRDKTLVAFSPDDIVSLSVSRSGTTVTVKREADDSWLITEPIKYSADADQITDILEFVSEAGAVGFAPEGADPAEYGLSAPAITLLLVDTGGAISRLLIGKPAGDNNYWAMREGRPSIFMVSEKVKNKLTVSADFIMDRSLLAYAAADVTAIEVSGPDGRISIVRDGRGWKITEPDQVKGDRNAVNALLSDLREMKVSGIVQIPAKDLGRYGLSRPTLAITLTADEGDTEHTSVLKLALTAGDTSYGYLSTGDFIFSIPTETIADFKPTFDSLKDRALLSFDKDTVTRITVAAGDKTYAFKKKGDTWKMTDPDRKKVDTALIDSLLGAIGDLSYSGVLVDTKDNLEQWELDEPRTAITLFGPDDKEIGRIAFGREEQKDDGRYTAAVSTSLKKTYGVDTDLVDTIKDKIEIIQEGR
ncbi:MAG: DUF4340 domain-containing protein [Deltaproteobacteria bacterium]|nr:DUF4340 domain-containing protein [Candidatus Zymogenaceae bacterium]